MFQKMSDEELERQTRDAEEERKRLVNGDQLTHESNFLHPDTASEFNSRYGGSLATVDSQSADERVPGAGIGNVQVERGAPLRRQRKKANVTNDGSDSDEVTSPTPPAPAAPAKKRNLTMFADKSIDWDGTGIPKNIADGSWSEKVGYAVGKKVGMTSAYAWTNFMYLTFQIWPAVIAVMAIGFVFLIEQVVGTGVTQEVFNKLLSAIGLDWDFYLVALLCYMVVVVVCYVQLFGVALQSKVLGLQPLSGFFKTAAFLLCFVGYAIPLLNCFPLVNIYILSIQLAPR